MFTNETEPGPVECRICHSKTTRDLILSPCLCKGSMGCVHIRCLEQWLNVSSHNFCELCSYRFEVIQVRRYSLLKSIRIWICQDQGSLYKAIFFIALSATNSFLLSWMWFLWLSNIPNAFVRSKDRDDGDEVPSQEVQEVSRPKWMAVFVFLTLLTLFSIKSLCFDGYKAVKSQYHAWYRWWNETVNVQLVLDLENYKIKNKLEEPLDMSLKFVGEKDNIPDQNALKDSKIIDVPIEDNYVTTFSNEIPEVHKTTNISASATNTSPTTDVEFKLTNGQSEKPQDKLENFTQVKATNSSEQTTVTDTPTDILYVYEKGGPNQDSNDMPTVHKQNKTEQE